MDFFKFISDGEATELDQGEQINGIDKSTWVERYRTEGEFTFEAKLSSGLMEFLPLGTLISHTDTYEIMIVENHELDEKQDEESLITITGRSFLTKLEDRIVGSNLARAGSSVTPYEMTTDYSWNQIVDLINDHIDTIFSDDNLEDVVATHVIPGTSVSEKRTIEYGTIFERVLELLKIDDLGMKTVRKNTFGAGISGNTAFVVHNGVNQTSDVIFTWQGGDVSEMKYLFTQKGHKTSAIVKGRYIWVVVDTTGVKYARKVMYINAEDIDGHLDTVPTGFDLAIVQALLNTRGHQALAAQNQITITSADISDVSRYHYRRDYDIGDLVSVAGNFGEIAVMRVIEFAEIQDENGVNGHPTFEIIGA